MTLTVFFKDATDEKFEDVLREHLLEDVLILVRDPAVHKEQAKIPRENIEYYVVKTETE